MTEKKTKRAAPAKREPAAKSKLPEGSLKQQNDAQAAVAVAPRVDLAEMQRKIVAETYYAHEHLTICVLEMKNGFFVTGTSAPASAANFDEEVGCKLAYEDCIKQLWRLEGYALREKLSQEKEPTDEEDA